MARNQTLTGIRSPKVCGGCHSHRLEDSVLHELLEAHTGNSLDRTLQKVKSLARVLKARTGLKPGSEQFAGPRTPVDKSCGVTEDMPSRNLFARAPRSVSSFRYSWRGRSRTNLPSSTICSTA